MSGFSRNADSLDILMMKLVDVRVESLVMQELVTMVESKIFTEHAKRNRHHQLRGARQVF